MTTSSRKHGRLSSLLVVALLSCCATLVLSSCSKKASVAIIGKWQVQGVKQGSKVRVEFRKDGTVITSYDITYRPARRSPGNTRPSEVTTTARYTFTDANHMNLQINTGDTNQPTILMSCEVHIQGNTMDMAVTAPGERQQHKTILKRLE